ncbi:MAG: transposase [Candidatus Binatia bacterium]
MRRKSRASGRPDDGLNRLRSNLAGIDLGTSEHRVCGPDREDGTPNVQTFRTTTSELKRLVRWLLDQGVKSVELESTHVDWIPVYELLESSGIEVVLLNLKFSTGPTKRRKMTG